MDPMQTFPVPEFGVGGLVLDIPATKRTPSQLSVADNIRIQDGEIASIPAPVDAYTFTKTPVFGHPFYLSDDSGGHIICYSDGTIEYVDSTGTPLDITPAVPLSNSDYFYAVQINDIFILTNGTDLPWQITQADIVLAGQLVPLINWPANYRARMFETFKSFVVAAGITIDGTEQRSMIKWSHHISPGDVSLFWDHTDPTLLAGENVLAVEGRNIKAIQSLRDNLIIYFDQALWRMSNVGGAFVMAFTKVFTDDGAVGPFAMADYDGNAIVVGFHDIYTHDGYNKQSLSDRKVTRAFYNNAVIDDNLRVAYYSERREMFILHKTRNTYVEYDAAFIFNVDYMAFTIMRLPGAAGTGGAIQFYTGPKFDAVDTSYDDAEIAGMTYDNSEDVRYNDIRISDEDFDFYLLTGVAKKLQAMDAQFVTCHEPSLIYVEIDRIDMVPVFKTKGDRIKYISRVYPQVTGSTVLQLSIGVSMLPHGGIEWKPWVTYKTAADWAVDARAAGRYMGIRGRMNPNENRSFSLAGFEFELMVPDAGRR